MQFNAVPDIVACTEGKSWWLGKQDSLEKGGVTGEVLKGDDATVRRNSVFYCNFRVSLGIF